MRHKFYFGLLLIFLSLNTNLYAQNYWVPDANFRSKLKQLYPSCFTAQDSMITNCSQIQNDSSLTVSHLSISSLSGIQYFLNLHYLDCAYNNLFNLPALPNSLTSLICANDKLNSLPQLPVSLKLLNCNTNQLSSLGTLPNSLVFLNCSLNQLSNLPSLPLSLRYLNCNYNPLTSLPTLPSLLNDLECQGNLLSSLPVLPDSLKLLDFSYNQFTSMPALPIKLKVLNCSNNGLTNLLAIPDSLEIFFCVNNLLTSLPLLPSTLRIFECGTNQLSSLPVLPDSLNILECSNNLLSSLPALPSTITLLICNHNQLTSLPVLPDSLKQLECTWNFLGSLPALPLKLGLLDCNRNNLTSLPALPPSLLDIYCEFNSLTSLPILPHKLGNLACSYNNLTSLPLIPGYTVRLDCFNNPLTCFPELEPRIIGSSPWQYINILNTAITCIPNQITIPLSNIYASQPLPFCSPLNNNCNHNYTSGYVFMDTNGNGIRENFESGMAIPVFYSGNYSCLPNSVGFFNAISDTGNITFQVNVPAYYTATTSTMQITHVTAGTINTLYFGFHPIPNIKDLKVDLTSISFLRPGFKANYKIHYQNVGTKFTTNVKVKYLKPSTSTNFSSLPAISATQGDTLIWNLPSLNPYQQGDILVQDWVSVSASLGDTATAYAWIEPSFSDTTPQNNSSSSTNIILGAYDPNYKSVSTQNVLPNSVDYLEYTIRFQNTGTDTAFAVMVIDTLSSLLNVSSMEMISSSHSYDLWIENGVAKWNFINILLPDSNTNELESHGFVEFRIKPLPGLTVADSIPNAANIYFDYNAAVTTNTIVVNVLNTTQVNELLEIDLQVFPNPVQDILRIVNQHSGPLGKIELINANGKVLETKTISTSSYTWNLQHLPAGTYILKGLGWGKKVVKN